LIGVEYPFNPVAVTVKVTLWPTGRFRADEGEDEGDTVSVKSCMDRTAEPLWLSDPLEPLTVTLRLPAPLAGVVTVMVEVPEPPAIVAELKLVEKPEGNAIAVRATAPLKLVPLAGATVTGR
jgi:hypothetical protein